MDYRKFHPCRWVTTDPSVHSIVYPTHETDCGRVGISRNASSTVAYMRSVSKRQALSAIARMGDSHEKGAASAQRRAVVRRVLLAGLVLAAGAGLLLPANVQAQTTVQSIVRHNPTTSPTNADSLVWRVTFSERVKHVDLTDFTIAGWHDGDADGIGFGRRVRRDGEACGIRTSIVDVLRRERDRGTPDETLGKKIR